MKSRRHKSIPLSRIVTAPMVDNDADASSTIATIDSMSIPGVAGQHLHGKGSGRAWDFTMPEARGAWEPLEGSCTRVTRAEDTTRRIPESHEFERMSQRANIFSAPPTASVAFVTPHAASVRAPNTPVYRTQTAAHVVTPARPRGATVPSPRTAPRKPTQGVIGRQSAQPTSPTLRGLTASADVVADLRMQEADEARVHVQRTKSKAAYPAANEHGAPTCGSAARGTAGGMSADRDPPRWPYEEYFDTPSSPPRSPHRLSCEPHRTPPMRPATRSPYDEPSSSLHAKAGTLRRPAWRDEVRSAHPLRHSPPTARHDVRGADVSMRPAPRLLRTSAPSRPPPGPRIIRPNHPQPFDASPRVTTSPLRVPRSRAYST